MKRNWILSGAVAAMLASASSAALAQDATPAPAPPAAPAPATTPAPDNTPAPMAPAPDATQASPAAPAPMATPAPDATAAPPPAPMAPAPDASGTPPTAPAPMAPMPMADPNAPAAPPMPMSNPGSLSSGSMSTGSTMMPGSIDFSVLNNPDFNYTDLKKAKAEGFSDNEVASIAKIAHFSGVSFTDITDQVLHGTTFSTLATRLNLNLGNVLDVADEKDKISAYETAYEATGTMALKNSGSMGMMSPSSPMSGSSTMTPPMSSGSGMSTPMAPTKDIVALAMSDKRFSTLVKELKRADLVSALQGPGPFTVFAPTNAAFKKLPKGALKDLEKDPTKLAAVLKYHVLPARVDAATATSMTSPTSPPTLEGSTLQVTSQGGAVKINDATVTQADLMATNGIIHAVDTVLMPSDLASSSSSSTSGSGNGTMSAPSTSGTDTTGTTSTTPTTPPASTDQTVPPASGSTPSDTTAPAGVSPSTPATPTPAAPDAGSTSPTTTPGTGTTTPATPAQ